MFNTANQDVRKAARISGIPLWRVALKIGVSQPTLTRWLRVQLPKEKKDQIMNAISDLEKEGN